MAPPAPPVYVAPIVVEPVYEYDNKSYTPPPPVYQPAPPPVYVAPPAPPVYVAPPAPPVYVAPIVVEPVYEYDNKSGAHNQPPPQPLTATHVAAMNQPYIDPEVVNYQMETNFAPPPNQQPANSFATTPPVSGAWALNIPSDAELYSRLSTPASADVYDAKGNPTSTPGHTATAEEVAAERTKIINEQQFGFADQLADQYRFNEQDRDVLARIMASDTTLTPAKVEEFIQKNPDKYSHYFERYDGALALTEVYNLSDELRGLVELAMVTRKDLDFVGMNDFIAAHPTDWPTKLVELLQKPETVPALDANNDFVADRHNPAAPVVYGSGLASYTAKQVEWTYEKSFDQYRAEVNPNDQSLWVMKPVVVGSQLGVVGYDSKGGQQWGDIPILENRLAARDEAELRALYISTYGNPLEKALGRSFNSFWQENITYDSKGASAAVVLPPKYTVVNTQPVNFGRDGRYQDMQHNGFHERAALFEANGTFNGVSWRDLDASLVPYLDGAHYLARQLSDLSNAAGFSYNIKSGDKVVDLAIYLDSIGVKDATKVFVENGRYVDRSTGQDLGSYDPGGAFCYTALGKGWTDFMPQVLPNGQVVFIPKWGDSSDMGTLILVVAIVLAATGVGAAIGAGLMTAVGATAAVVGTTAFTVVSTALGGAIVSTGLTALSGGDVSLGSFGKSFALGLVGGAVSAGLQSVGGVAGLAGAGTLGGVGTFVNNAVTAGISGGVVSSISGNGFTNGFVAGLAGSAASQAGVALVGSVAGDLGLSQSTVAAAGQFIGSYIVNKDIGQALISAAGAHYGSSVVNTQTFDDGSSIQTLGSGSTIATGSNGAVYVPGSNPNLPKNQTPPQTQTFDDGSVLTINNGVVSATNSNGTAYVLGSNPNLPQNQTPPQNQNLDPNRPTGQTTNASGQNVVEFANGRTATFEGDQLVAGSFVSNTGLIIEADAGRITATDPAQDGRIVYTKNGDVEYRLNSDGTQIVRNGQQTDIRSAEGHLLQTVDQRTELAFTYDKDGRVVAATTVGGSPMNSDQMAIVQSAAVQSGRANLEISREWDGDSVTVTYSDGRVASFNGAGQLVYGSVLNTAGMEVSLVGEALVVKDPSQGDKIVYIKSGNVEYSALENGMSATKQNGITEIRGKDGSLIQQIDEGKKLQYTFSSTGHLLDVRRTDGQSLTETERNDAFALGRRTGSVAYQINGGPGSGGTVIAVQTREQAIQNKFGTQAVSEYRSFLSGRSESTALYNSFVASKQPVATIPNVAFDADAFLAGSLSNSSGMNSLVGFGTAPVNPSFGSTGGTSPQSFSALSNQNALNTNFGLGSASVTSSMSVGLSTAGSARGMAEALDNRYQQFRDDASGMDYTLSNNGSVSSAPPSYYDSPQVREARIADLTKDIIGHELRIASIDRTIAMTPSTIATMVSNIPKVMEGIPQLATMAGEALGKFEQNVMRANGGIEMNTAELIGAVMDKGLSTIAKTFASMRDNTDSKIEFGIVVAGGVLNLAWESTVPAVGRFLVAMADPNLKPEQASLATLELLGAATLLVGGAIVHGAARSASVGVQGLTQAGRTVTAAILDASIFTTDGIGVRYAGTGLGSLDTFLSGVGRSSTNPTTGSIAADNFANSLAGPRANDMVMSQIGAVAFSRPTLIDQANVASVNTPFASNLQSQVNISNNFSGNNSFNMNTTAPAITNDASPNFSVRPDTTYSPAGTTTFAVGGINFSQGSVVPGPVLNPVFRSPDANQFINPNMNPASQAPVVPNLPATPGDASVFVRPSQTASGPVADVPRFGNNVSVSTPTVALTAPNGLTLHLPQRPQAIEDLIQQADVRVRADIAPDDPFMTVDFGRALDIFKQIDQDLRNIPTDRQIKFPDFGGVGVSGQYSVVNHAIQNNTGFAGHGGNIAGVIGEDAATVLGFARRNGVDIFPDAILLNQRLDILNSSVPQNYQIQTRFYTPDADQRVSASEYVNRYLNDRELPIAMSSDELAHDVNAHVMKQIVVPRELENHFVNQQQGIIDMIAALKRELPTEFQRPELLYGAASLDEVVYNKVASRIDNFTAGIATSHVSFALNVADIPQLISRQITEGISSISGRSVIDEIRLFANSMDLSTDAKWVVERYLINLSLDPAKSATIDVARMGDEALNKLAEIQQAARASLGITATNIFARAGGTVIPGATVIPTPVNGSNASTSVDAASPDTNPVVDTSNQTTQSMLQQASSNPDRAFEQNIVSLTASDSHVTNVRPIDGELGSALLFTFDDGTQGVWKPAREGHGGAYSVPEVAAYHVSQLIGENFVPTVTYRIHNGEVGTIQLFVASDTALLKSQGLELADDPIRASFFDALIGNPDRNGGNYLSVAGRMVLIDNSPGFSSYDTAFQQFREHLATEFKAYLQFDLDNVGNAAGNSSALQRLQMLLPSQQVFDRLVAISNDSWRSTLGSNLSSTEIDNFVTNKDRLIREIHGIQREFGSDILGKTDSHLIETRILQNTDSIPVGTVDEVSDADYANFFPGVNIQSQSDAGIAKSAIAAVGLTLAAGGASAGVGPGEEESLEARKLNFLKNFDYQKYVSENSPAQVMAKFGFTLEQATKLLSRDIYLALVENLPEVTLKQAVAHSLVFDRLLAYIELYLDKGYSLQEAQSLIGRFTMTEIDTVLNLLPIDQQILIRQRMAQPIGLDAHYEQNANVTPAELWTGIAQAEVLKFKNYGQDLAAPMALLHPSIDKNLAHFVFPLVTVDQQGNKLATGSVSVFSVETSEGLKYGFMTNGHTLMQNNRGPELTHSDGRSLELGSEGLQLEMIKFDGSRIQLPLENGLSILYGRSNAGGRPVVTTGTDSVRPESDYLIGIGNEQQMLDFIRQAVPLNQLQNIPVLGANQPLQLGDQIVQLGIPGYINGDENATNKFVVVGSTATITKGGRIQGGIAYQSTLSSENLPHSGGSSGGPLYVTRQYADPVTGQILTQTRIVGVNTYEHGLSKGTGTQLNGGGAILIDPSSSTGIILPSQLQVLPMKKPA